VRQRRTFETSNSMAFNSTHLLRRAGPMLLCVAALAGCTVAKPRTDDPYEKFNRKMYAFNDAADKAVIRPVAATYRKVTSDTMRRLVANFFANVKMPITIANDVLQVEPRSRCATRGGSRSTRRSVSPACSTRPAR
jgi:phospholipid-binding lipoprotein MlaA